MQNYALSRRHYSNMKTNFHGWVKGTTVEDEDEEEEMRMKKNEDEEEEEETEKTGSDEES